MAGSPPPRKLDLRYFTTPALCPAMTHDGARRPFELFLYLAHRFLLARGNPIVPTHEELCLASGLNPASPSAQPGLSRALRMLRERYRVIDFTPTKRRRPEIRLVPPGPGSDPLNPRHYIYFREGFDADGRATFAHAGRQAFAAEYLYWIAMYEADLARVKHHRAYWFFPLARLSQMYHLGQQFAANGLRALVDLGVLTVVPGQRGRVAPAGEFGPANRYYFHGLGAVTSRLQERHVLQSRHGKVFDVASELANKLINRRTVENVRGLCELIADHGDAAVRRAVEQVDSYGPRNLRRRLEYVRAIIAGGGKQVVSQE